MKRLILMMTMGIAACGGGANSYSVSSSTSGPGGTGQIALKVSGAKSFNPNIPAGKIKQYVITVSADGFAPIQTAVSGDATEASIDGIPTGDHRTVSVVAINPNDQTIREGEASDVAIPGGGATEVPITLQAVPVITNVADGSYVANTRLRLSIYSDPATTVELTADTGKTVATLNDVVENRPLVATDASTGVASFVPPQLAPGDYTLTVRDSKTGRKSQVSIVVTDGAREHGAPLVSGARLVDRHPVMQSGEIFAVPAAQRVGMSSVFLVMRAE